MSKRCIQQDNRPGRHIINLLAEYLCIAVCMLFSIHEKSASSVDGIAHNVCVSGLRAWATINSIEVARSRREYV